jgi:hypothetical protein
VSQPVDVVEHDGLHDECELTSWGELSLSGDVDAESVAAPGRATARYGATGVVGGGRMSIRK